ncbi:unnamed protein product [Bursaphelenchus okinawaensis]|uniref:Uncharacterized protein n=1 Tax=Bursaphelenchus okinawaensis TaxID=465554 RepID=A0A811LG95_9BILA|nr:unnamed protein product [Bursaphelenchus okinawaensis]CAG9121894.1 unnamed protein product [Bursaphelenchus okinawaensis]
MSQRQQDNLPVYSNGVDLRPIVFLFFILTLLAGFLVLGGLDIVRKSFKATPTLEEHSDVLENVENTVSEVDVQQWIYKFGAVRCPARLNQTMDYAFEELDLQLGLAFLDNQYKFADLRETIERMRPLIANCALDQEWNKLAQITHFRQSLGEIRHKW